MLLLKKQKGQGLTEFALILPLLLLLLLGIIEASRIIWAYITVQTAAREAARYAVTGRPYLTTSGSTALGQIDICRGEDPEPDPIQVSAAPWLCEPATARLGAIYDIAMERGNTLAVSEPCLGATRYQACTNTPGAFGVLIRGQVTTQTVTGTTVVDPIPKDDHPGQQGLLVEVNTYYNVQMLTPIFDVLMGGQPIRLQGVVRLQNEGLDETANVAPPPPLPPPPTPQGGTGPGGGFGVAGQIWSVSGYRVRQGDALRVHLENHPPGTGYDILLSGGGNTYVICKNVNTNSSNKTSPDPACPLTTTTMNVPPGFYTLFSAVTGSTSPVVAQDERQVEVVLGGSPQLLVEGGTTWAANSVTNLFLQFHLNTEAPFTIKLFDGNGNFVENVSTNAGVNTAIAWTVPDMVGKGLSACDQLSKKPCTLRSYKGAAVRASTQVYINQPSIELSSGNGPYARGETIYIYLRSHTPGQRYNVKIPGTSQTAILDSVNTNSAGDTTVPIVWTVPTGCGFGQGWPDGYYTFTSHPLGGSGQIARRPNVRFQTPATPFLTVEGGYTWNTGSFINIRVHQHLSLTDHYLTFDGVRIPTSASDDTFTTGTCGDAIVGFNIPVDATEGTHLIRSYDKATNTLQAVRAITILSAPVILVEEGDTVLPNQTITIKLLNHQPFFNYQVLYAGKLLEAVLTGQDGTSTISYDLETELPKLPISPPPNLSDPASYGKPYILESRSVADPDTSVAQTELTLLIGDLAVIGVHVPATVQANSMVTSVITFQNKMPVPIERWVDLDMYLNPEPVAPSHLYGYNFPGDIKYWRNSIAANEVFTITHAISVPTAGSQVLYGYADTTNFVFEAEQAGQVANPNNLGSKNFLANCGGTALVDTFGTAAAQGAVPNGWQVIRFGDSTGGYGTHVTGGKLYLNSTGSSNWQSNDNSGGEMLVYRPLAVPSASGMEVQVAISSLDLAGSYAKAGIEIRNAISDTTSPRVLLGVARINGASGNPPNQARQSIQAGYRDGGGMSWVGSDTDLQNNHRVWLPSIDPAVSGPDLVWLRIEREAGGGGTFNLYYRKNPPSNPPAPDAPAATKAAWWGSPVRTVSVSGIGDNLYVGLFNSPYSSSTAGTSVFDNFGYWPAANCDQQQSVVPLPPGLEICGEVLSDRGFETNPAQSPWVYPAPFAPSPGNVSRSPGTSHIGNFALKASSFDGTPNTPHFYQTFQLGDWVLSTTTKLKLSFFKNVDMQGDGAQPNDQLYAIVTTGPNSTTWTALTNPVPVAHGGEGVAGGFDPTKWIQFAPLELPVKAGVNLENYKGQTLYLYFYNNSNIPSGVACTGGCRTHFYLDDMSLSSCTSEPMPATVATRIKGQLTLNYSNGTFESLPYVKVWAYAENGQVFETFSIQNGEFNFFNLPASPSGTDYTLFAQYHLVDPNDPTQIETLWADSTITLQSIHTNDNPQITFLDLYSLD